MSTRYTLLIFLALSAAPLLTAQATYQQLLPAGNDVTTASGNRVTWSLGDVFADDVSGSQAIIISKVDNNLADTHGLRLIGNPTRDYTRLELAKSLSISYKLFDLQGRELLHQDAGNVSICAVDLSGIPPQVYLLSVFANDSGRLIATYRVHKL